MRPTTSSQAKPSGPADSGTSSLSSAYATSTTPAAGLSNTFNAIWDPRWCKEKHAWTFEGTAPDPHLFNALSQKMVLHLTMSAVRGE